MPLANYYCQCRNTVKVAAAPPPRCETCPMCGSPYSPMGIEPPPPALHDPAPIVSPKSKRRATICRACSTLLLLAAS